VRKKRELITVPIEALHCSANIRSKPSGIEELADSYLDGGPEQPPVVSPNGDGYDVVLGQRRVLAAQAAGEIEMQVIVRDPIDARARVILQLVENIQREDLCPLDEALAIKTLLQMGDRQKDIAEWLGKSEAYVSQRLSLLKLDPTLQSALARGEIGPSVAELLASLDKDQQEAVLPQVRGKPVRQVKTIVKQSVVKARLQQPNGRRQDEYDILLDNGDDPLLVLALHRLQEAENLAREVYREYRLGTAGPMLAKRIQDVAQSLVRIAQTIDKCVGGENGRAS